MLCGPLLCATSQAVNDWFDREVDAINEPNRPIPSGRMPGRWGLYIAMSLEPAVAGLRGRVGALGLCAAARGLVLAWAYSAPPVRLKQNGWWGNLACAVCYEGFAWITGAVVFPAGAAPSARILALGALYSLGAHGIMTLNDFKSIEGDRRLGIGSLPVRLGAERAGEVACVAMAAPQFVVVVLLDAWGATITRSRSALLARAAAADAPAAREPARARALVQRDRRESVRAWNAGQRVRLEGHARMIDRHPRRS